MRSEHTVRAEPAFRQWRDKRQVKKKPEVSRVEIGQRIRREDFSGSLNDGLAAGEARWVVVRCLPPARMLSVKETTRLAKSPLVVVVMVVVVVVIVVVVVVADADCFALNSRLSATAEQLSADRESRAWADAGTGLWCRTES